MQIRVLWLLMIIVVNPHQHQITTAGDLHAYHYYYFLYVLSRSTAHFLTLYESSDMATRNC